MWETSDITHFSRDLMRCWMDFYYAWISVWRLGMVSLKYPMPYKPGTCFYAQLDEQEINLCPK